jgi:N-formylglutamate amidohydrolase
MDSGPISRLPHSAPPAFDIERPASRTAPLVFASPHSGADYPEAFVRRSSLDPLTLRKSEDCFVDRLFSNAIAHGAVLIKAHFPRAYVDVNREPWELDPAMFADALPGYANTRSPRVAAGLGTIAKVVASGAEIYRDKLTFAEVKARISQHYEPYHAALRDLMAETKERFGFCILIDCHSMPSIGGPHDRDIGAPRVDIVLGDCFGTSCAPAVTNRAESLLRQQALAVKRNDPYAGGFTTRHYGRPQEGMHALQIEMNRALYMDEQLYQPHAGFQAMSDKLSAFIAAMATFTEQDLTPSWKYAR